MLAVWVREQMSCETICMVGDYDKKNTILLKVLSKGKYCFLKVFSKKHMNEYD